MDGLEAHLEERHPSHWDNPPLSLEQYIEEIRPIVFEAAQLRVLA